MYFCGSFLSLNKICRGWSTEVFLFLLKIHVFHLAKISRTDLFFNKDVIFT